jgi:hypothetical protein
MSGKIRETLDFFVCFLDTAQPFIYSCKRMQDPFGGGGIRVMKRLLLGLSLVIGAWMLSPTPEAEARSWQKARQMQKRHVRVHGHKAGFGVPELDPSAAGGAIVLLLGGVAYIASRRREEDLA